MNEENSEPESVKSTKSDSVLVKARRGRRTNAERLGLRRIDSNLKNNKIDNMAKSSEVKIGNESLADYLKRKFS